MVCSRRTAPILACFALVSVAGLAGARSVIHFPDIDDFPQEAPFAMQDTPLGGTQQPAPAGRTAAPGSTIATFEGDALVVDADSGTLVRTDRDGHKQAELLIGPSAAQLVVDRDHARAYVANRSGDRIAVVDLTEGLRTIRAFSTRTEPFGLALSADGRTLLVTHVADQSLSAYDTTTGHEQWSMKLGPEPRGVALADDGSEALVTFLTTGVVARVDLLALGKPKVQWVTIDPPVRKSSNHVRHRKVVSNRPASGDFEAVHDPDEGRSFARNAFAAAYVGHGVAVVPHQVSTPHLPSDGDFVPAASGYGGGDGFTAPISHRLAFLQMPDGEAQSVRTAFATTRVHQPRALAYDAAADTLYMAGYGSDDVVAIANVSQTSVHLAWSASLASGEACGPSGLAIDDSDGSVLAFCSLTRKTMRVAPGDDKRAATVVAHSSTLTQSRLSEAAQRGQVLFRDGTNPRLSKHGAMACASCHAEARSDGLTWFLEGHRLQTPLLAGRLVGSHPFKWDGKDTTLQASLTNTVLRLGGSGIGSREASDLQAFLTSVEPPRAPTVADARAAERGKQLFESDRTGCAKCHFGALLTDQKRHALAPDLGEVDTPSLVGLAHSAPYYHDGSATTLEALLRGNGSIHGMGRISRLTDAEIDDLVAYMKTL